MTGKLSQIFTAVALLSCVSTVLAPPSMAASASEGQLAFNNHCRTCHSVREGDNRLGPSLHGVIGREAGTLKEYPNYSQSMRSAGIVWDEATLDKFIANPESVVRNNNMKPYAGLPDAEVRKAIVDYLKTASEEDS